MVIGMAKYISDNSSFIILVNGFLHSGITAAMNGVVEVGSGSHECGIDGDCNSDSDVCEISDDETVP